MNRRRLMVTTTLTALLLTVTAAASDAQTNRGSAGKDACTLVSNDEIGTAAGTTVRSSRPRQVPDGSECQYQTGAGFAVTIVISPVEAKDFAELRDLFGAEAQPVAGVGDAAYFLGNERLYVRVGRQQLVVTRGSEADATFRDVLLAIARLAVPRL